ncbi:hypothetical protein ACHAWF_003278 [Thalassiosira exigua]
MTRASPLIVSLLLASAGAVLGFAVPPPPSSGRASPTTAAYSGAAAPGRGGTPSLLASRRHDDGRDLDFPASSRPSSSAAFGRRRLLAAAPASLLLPSSLIAAAAASFPAPSSALVKGNAPPPKRKPDSGGGDPSAPRCRNVEECQEQAERAEAARLKEEAARSENGPKPIVASAGTRYLDVESGSGSVGRVARTGDVAEVHYKVLKLGKRSYDGLSGEGTVVFSRGYALEDDEKVPGDKTFKFRLGDARVIAALNDAVPGMAVGSVRRIGVTPRNGWEKNTPSCDGGPGGSGTGGDLRTDYVVVPTATMVEQEACFDRTKLPFPRTYAQERRMAQRFDQSLIMEVRLVGVS